MKLALLATPTCGIGPQTRDQRKVTTTWRLLIDDGPVDGVWNMALDRAIQVLRQAEESAPTLRLYRWKRPTVTLGRFQAVESIDRGFCEANGIDVVRRFTGGRGVLHDDEVTYSIVAGLSDGVPRGVAASYRMLCGGLAETYRRLGVDAALTALPRGDRTSAACYLHATAADLSLGARKLSGSAQVWLGSTVLQHGSFTISRDIARDGRVFRLEDVASARLKERTATLADVLAEPPSVEQIVAAAISGISGSLGIELAAGSPTPEELDLASQLLPEVDPDGVASR